jgi:2-hydroxychromene-2-carboxylate isomerase
MEKLEFFFDVGSPYSYLAFHRLQKIKAEVDYRPMLLGGVFQATGNKSPVENAAKSAYSRHDLMFFANRYGVNFAMHPNFPINTLPLMRGATGYLMQDKAKFLRYVTAIYGAMFDKPRDMADIAPILSENGLDPQEYAALIQNPDVKEALKNTTEEAVKRGVFGAPTFFYKNHMMFGQDRLIYLEEML